MDRGGGRRDGPAAAARLDAPVARAVPLERERPVKTPEMDARFKALGAERLRDPEYQRYVQGFRSHDSLSEAGKVGYRVTGEKHGWEFVHDKIAATRRDRPSDDERRMIGLLAELGERDARGTGEPGHVYEREYKVAPFTHVDFAWPESGKVIEVYGGVHLIPELDPNGTRAAYDAARIERIEGLGWEVLVVTSDDLTTANRGEVSAAIRAFLQDTPQRRADFSPADAATLDAIFVSPDHAAQDRGLAAGYERFDPDRLRYLLQGERAAMEAEVRGALADRLAGRGQELGPTLDATAVPRGRNIDVDAREERELAAIHAVLAYDEFERDDGLDPPRYPLAVYSFVAEERQGTPPPLTRSDATTGRDWQTSLADDARTMAEMIRTGAAVEGRDLTTMERTVWTQLDGEARAHDGTALRFDVLAQQLGEREHQADMARYAAGDMALLERLERDDPAFVETVTADVLRRWGIPSPDALGEDDRARLRGSVAEELGVRQEAAQFIAIDMTELRSLEATYQELTGGRGGETIGLASASAAREAASLSREAAAFDRDEAHWAEQRGGLGDEEEIATFLGRAEEWDHTAARFEELEQRLSGAPRPVSDGEARALEDVYHGLAEERGHDLPGPLNAYMARRGADMSRETAMDYRTAAAFEVRQAPSGQPLDAIGREAATHWRAEADRYDAQAERFDVLAAQLDERAAGNWEPGYSNTGGVSPLTFAAPPDVF